MQGTRSSSQIYLLSLVLDVVILTAHFLRISITYLNNQKSFRQMDRKQIQGT